MQILPRKMLDKDIRQFQIVASILEKTLTSRHCDCSDAVELCSPSCEYRILGRSASRPLMNFAACPHIKFCVLNFHDGGWTPKKRSDMLIDLIELCHRSVKWTVFEKFEVIHPIETHTRTTTMGCLKSMYCMYLDTMRRYGIYVFTTNDIPLFAALDKPTNTMARTTKNAQYSCIPTQLPLPRMLPATGLPTMRPRPDMKAVIPIHVPNR